MYYTQSELAADNWSLNSARFHVHSIDEACQRRSLTACARWWKEPDRCYEWAYWEYQVKFRIVHDWRLDQSFYGQQVILDRKHHLCANGTILNSMHLQREPNDGIPICLSHFLPYEVKWDPNEQHDVQRADFEPLFDAHYVLSLWTYAIIRQRIGNFQD